MLQNSYERGVRKYGRNNLQPKAVKKKWEKVHKAPEQISLQPVVKTMVMQVVSLQPMVDYNGAGIHTAACGGPHAGPGIYVLKETASHKEPTQEQVFFQDLWFMGDPGWSSPFLKDCAPWKGPMLEQLMKNCSPWEEATLRKFPKDCIL
ncbi:hypothetical protein llap_6105 [Limosa lapponica baueri]|uniref:Uncharacterized protein n=1 Tax=Limosa lapponica baueri TaxID=1758121 RepID=A0A2I0UC28_LIMLA|nr:hypothetical protein llap_6105 [Limosa lapponica baueri]